MASDTASRYPGAELHVFANARCWKGYWSRYVSRFIGPKVLEVGAGIGANTVLLCDASVERWVCLEPDRRLAEELRTSLERASLDGRCEVVPGTSSDLEDDRGFDAVLYLDVLEHIYEDRAELARAASLLRPGGALVVLAPAHEWLWTSFDTAIGHHRRYTRSALRAIVPKVFAARLLIYLDSMGLLVSLANRCLLRQATPTARQIAVWDRILVPISRCLDPLLCYLLGRSVLGVWQKASGLA